VGVVGGGHDVRVAPTIVFLHGFTLTGASWQPVVEGLGERYRSLRPDIRGHGAAAAARPIDFDSCVQDVVARIAALARAAVAGEPGWTSTS